VVITLDQGRQFTSALWDSLCATLGIKHMQITAYHAQANGLVEQFHRRLKDPLLARLASPTRTAHLSWVLLGLLAAPHKDYSISPAQAVFGTPIVLPGQFLDANANVNEMEFLKKFSNELGATESIATRNNSAWLETCWRSCPKPCLDPLMPPAEPRHHGHPPRLPKAMTFLWLHVMPPPARLAVPAAPTSPPLSPMPLPALAAAMTPSPPG
jgi:hypothetical protein